MPGTDVCVCVCVCMCVCVCVLHIKPFFLPVDTHLETFDTISNTTTAIKYIILPQSISVDP